MFSVAAAWAKRDQGRQLPAWLDDEPYLPPVGAFFVEAFFALNTCRSVGMGPGEIPWTAAMEFADRHGLDDASARILWYVLRAMDIAYLEWVEDERDKRTTGSDRPQLGDKPRVVRRGV